MASRRSIRSARRRSEAEREAARRRWQAMVDREDRELRAKVARDIASREAMDPAERAAEAVRIFGRPA